MNCLSTSFRILLFFIGIATFSSLSTAKIPSIEPGTAFEPLTPTTEHTNTARRILSNLQGGHYELRRIDDRFSEKIFNLYLEDLDGTKSYFYQSDVEEFNNFRRNLDNELKRGELDHLFQMYNRLQSRASERLSFMINELEQNITEYKFDTDEALNLDREKSPWAKNKKELDDLWKKRLKNAYLNLLLSGKEPEAAIDLLKRRYQNQLNRIHQSKPEDAFQTAMNSVSRAFDPHTQYLSPRSSEDFNINMSLSLQGIGAVLKSEDEFTKVVRLVPAGPADKAGNLQPGDRIVGVAQGVKGEMVDVIGWRLDEVVDLIRGPKGSTVRLDIIPSDSADESAESIRIVRNEVKLEEESAQKDLLIIDDGDKQRRIGVIDIPTFYLDFRGRMLNLPDYRSTTRDVTRLIKELRSEGIEGLVIDLRNNGGGSLDEAIALTGLFIDKGPVVQVRSTSGNVEVLKDEDSGVLYDGPLVVLVNRLSASASEIFAGAIQDYGRGIIVGGQTFGKGTVQSIRRLPHGQLKITQAKFYRISGESTQHQGVIPDILYPTLFDKDKIGESSLDEALPWDTIRPVYYSKNRNVDKAIPPLRDQHEKRSETDPDFEFLRAQKAMVEELRGQKYVSLNRKVRQTEREENEAKRLELENKRRKAKDLPLLTELKDEEDGQESAKNDSKKSEETSEEAKEKDALLVESGNILLDYIDTIGAKNLEQISSRAR